MMTIRRTCVLVALTLLVFAGLPASAQEPPAAKPTARISGRVVDAANGRPIAGAMVRLVTQQGRQLSAGSDAGGRFEFAGLAAGRYRLTVSAERYLAMQFGGTPSTGLSGVAPRFIVLDAGEHFDKADVALPRPGAIEGRVYDEFGDPAPNITVRLSQLMYAAGRRRLMPVG